MPRRDTPEGFVDPMQARDAAQLPEGPEWVYEVKLDGYRAQAISSGLDVQLLSRNGLDLGHRFPTVVAQLRAALPVNSIVDGELVALDANGRPRFNLLQNYASGKAPVVFFAFDLMRLDGEDLTLKPLRERRELLRQWFVTSETAQLSESFHVPAEQMLATVRALGLEGVVAKRLSSCYECGRRTGAWVKVRVELSQEFVIAGFTPGTHGFDALLIGFYRPAAALTREERAKLPPSRRQYVFRPPELIFCSSVRAGFVPASRRTLFTRLEPLIRDTCPFANLPEASPGRWGMGLTAAKMKKCVWLRPELVGQFQFLEWTFGDKLRHVSFQGLREDKAAHDVVKEGEPPTKKPPQSVPAKPTHRRVSP